jgi:hypothetical protein
VPNYPNLSGFGVNIRDGNLALTRPAPKRPFLFVLGTASDGPLNKPVQVDSISNANELYGGTAGTLVKKIIEASNFDGTMYAVRIGTSNYATLDLHGTGRLVFTARYPGTAYHSLYASQAAGVLKIYNFKSLETVSFTLASYATNEALCAAINGNDEIRKVVVASTNSLASAPTAGAVVTTYMTGGTDFLYPTNAQLDAPLTSALTLLESSVIDYIVAAGVYANGTLTKTVNGNPVVVNTGFAKKLADFCYTMNTTGQSPTLAIVSVSGAHTDDQATYNTYVAKVIAQATTPSSGEPANNFYIDATTTPAVKTIVDFADSTDDLGMFLSVVTGEPVINNSLGVYYPEGDALYAALMASLATISACTGKRLSQTTALRNLLSRTQLNDLAGARLVAFEQGNGYVSVSDAPSASKETSDYNRNHTVRIVLGLIEDIKDVCRPFLGESFTPYTYNAMNTKIADMIQKHIDAGALNDGEHSILVTARSQVLGQATVELLVQPAFELRKIFISIALNEGRAVTEFAV